MLGRQPLPVGDIILLEVLQGITNDAEATRIEAGLRRFSVEPMLDAEPAVLAVRHVRRLRTAGITVRNTIDLVIGHFCIVRGHPLLISDRDLRPMAEHLGLRLD